MIFPGREANRPLKSPKKAVSEHTASRMVHPDRIALVVKTLCQLDRQSKVDIDLAQQQRAGVGGQSATGEIGHDLAGAQISEEQGLFGGEAGDLDG